MSEVSMVIGSFNVGSVRLDENQVRDEGSPLNPHLVVPITVGLTARPISQQLALTNLWCTLNLEDPPQPATQVGPPIPVLGNGAFLASSPATGKYEPNQTSLPLTTCQRPLD